MPHCMCNKTGGCKMCHPFLFEKEIRVMSHIDIIKMLEKIAERVCPHSCDIPDNIIWKIAEEYGINNES